MGEKDSYIRLVRRAQLGDEKSLNRLAELARERLREYVYRITLADDLTQDILQESMLEMFKFLDKLEKAERFWPWLRRIAANKIRHHYAREHRRRPGSISATEGRGVQKAGQEGIAGLVSQELKQTVFAALNELKARHRHVLVLRCYEGMKYSEIAEEMGCSEFGARRLFYRAKGALAKQLSRRGLGKESLLVVLVLFGKMTATSEAAAASVSVTATTLKVGVTASLAALVTTKTAVVSLVAAGVIAAGSVAIAPLAERTGLGPRESLAGSLVDGSQRTGVNKPSQQCWYYYPPNATGVVMMRVTSKTDAGQSYCQWLHNDQANYYRRRNAIRINNCRMWAGDLTVWRLPTDPPGLREFLSRVEGTKETMDYVRNNGNGLLVTVEHDGNGEYSQIAHRYDISDEEYFRYGWPAGAEIVDNRDAMHMRGWTYFRVTGQINGKDISGTGRIPFVYATSKRFGPWLVLQLGDGSKIVDTGTEACVYSRGGEAVARYKGGSFFKGLGRPWTGLHTIDTVRRDAAEKHVWFETKLASGGDKAEVVLTLEEGQMVYGIDMATDVIETITFSADDGDQEELEFSYLQDIDDVGSEFVQPRTRRRRRPHGDDQGMLWLVNLVNGRW